MFEGAVFSPVAFRRSPRGDTLRFARLVNSPGQGVDIALRKIAWDTDPGWAPRLGRVIRIHYVSSAELGVGER